MTNYNNLNQQISLTVTTNRKELIKALQMFPRNYVELVIFSDYTIQITDDTKYLKIKGID